MDHLVVPDKTRRTYLLPIKKAVRMAENLEVGAAAVTLRLMADPGARLR